MFRYHRLEQSRTSNNNNNNSSNNSNNALRSRSSQHREYYFFSYILQLLAFLVLSCYCCCHSSKNNVFPFLQFAVAQSSNNNNIPPEFRLLNIEKATIQQVFQLSFFGWDKILVSQEFSNGDFVSFSTSNSCPAGGPPTAPNRFRVIPADGGASGTVTVITLSSIFTVGSTYYVCYYSSMTGVNYLAKGTPITVLDYMFTTSAIFPLEPTAGQGPIQLSFTEVDQTSEGRAFDAPGLNQWPFLLPCPGGDCSDGDQLVAQCAVSPYPNGAVQAVSRPTGYRTGSISTSFVVPLQPATAYAVCVPFCGRPSESGSSCTPDTVTSYALVKDSKLVFYEANPSVYAVTPTSVQARQLGTLTFTGVELTSSDLVSLREPAVTTTGGYLCGGALISNVILNSLTTQSDPATTSTITFKLTANIPTSITAQICYARAASSDVYAPVFKAVGGPAADLVIAPMEPRSFTVVQQSPPCIGQTFDITFVGTGLNAANDAARVVYGQTLQCVMDASTDPCDETTYTADIYQFPCTMSGGTNPVCRVTVDPPDLNSFAKNLCVCYKLQASPNYALVDGELEVKSRNPVFSIAPYPFYAGQAATITFTGTGLLPTDTLKLVAVGAGCGGAELDTVSLKKGTAPNTFIIVGHPDVCFDVCYLQGAQATVTRPQVAKSLTPGCNAAAVYISPPPLDYTVAPETLREQQTVSVSFSSATPQNLASIYILQQPQERCATLLCGGRAPCDGETAPDNYAIITLGSTGMFMVSNRGKYMICVGLNGDRVPVPFATTDNYVLDIGPRNPSQVTLTPPQWRVNMQLMTMLFTGLDASLSNATDDVGLLTASAMLQPSVCPLDNTNLQVALSSGPVYQPGADNSTTLFAFRGSENISPNTELSICYYKGPVRGSRIPIFMGTLTMYPSNPSSVEMSPIEVRAGRDVSLTFTAASPATLNPSADTVTFYRYTGTSTQCRCVPSDCSGTTEVVSNIRLTGNTQRTVWRNPQGFSNYGEDVHYVVCYTVASVGVPTYLNSISVGRAHPSYFSSDLNGNVGRPFIITVTTACTTDCPPPMSDQDSIILVESNTQCADATSSAAEVADGPILQPGGTSSSISLVPLRTGSYRVCYKFQTGNKYMELPLGSDYQLKVLQAAPADPSNFVSFPPAPTALQYLRINFTGNCQDACQGCRRLRLVPGEVANCWKPIPGTIATTNCPQSNTVMDFARTDIAENVYTLCYGSSVPTSRRVPGKLTVGAANPLQFHSVFNDYDIFVNQATPSTVEFTGTGLTVGDNVALLPFTSDYHCHDLENIVNVNIFSNAAEAKLWFPSSSPQPITVSADGTKAWWNITNSDNRFGYGILDATYCTTRGVSCELRMCYRRAGTSWASVPSAAGNMTLYPANPSKITLDVKNSFRVTLNVLATVEGQGLTELDDVYLSDGNCESGNVVAIKVSTALVNSEATVWQAVIRFTAQNQKPVKACFKRGPTVTEILNMNPTIHTIATELRYMNNPLVASPAHVFTDMELLGVAAVANLQSPSPLQSAVSMTLVENQYECSYPNFPPAQHPILRQLSRFSTGNTDYFGERLVYTGKVSLCLYATDVPLTFRITDIVGATKELDAITIGEPNPIRFESFPPVGFVMAEQVVNITFHVTVPRVQYPDDSYAALLGHKNDTVTIIDGTLFECGLPNATVIKTINVDMTTPAETLTISTVFTTTNGGYTVCYGKTDGNPASVPHQNNRDQNLPVTPLFPRRHSTTPVVVQSGIPFRLTLHSESLGELRAGDHVKLLAIADGQTMPYPENCTEDSVAVLETNSVTVQNGNHEAVWNVAAAPAIGQYVVCYRRAGGGYAYVPDPGLLTVAPRTSPYDFTTDTPTGKQILVGERVHVFLTSNVELNPQLDIDPNLQANADLVRFSTNRNCAVSPEIKVSVIPESLGYVDPSTTGPGKYVFVRFRSSGNYFVCVKRFGVDDKNAYYNYMPIGIPPDYSVLRVDPAAVTSLKLDPQNPRVRIPRIVMAPTLRNPFRPSDMMIVFASKYPDSGPVDIVDRDGCYFPFPSEAKMSAPALIDLTHNATPPAYEVSIPFTISGRYTLCYQLEDRPPASLPTPFEIYPPVPQYYTVPSTMAVGTVSDITLHSSLVTVLLNHGAEAHVHTYDNTNNIMDCSNPHARLAPGTSVVSTFGGTNALATMTLTITQPGTYFLCYKPFDQHYAAPVPIDIEDGSGGFVFSLGLDGPTSYSIQPMAPRMGQTVLFDIRGTSLTNGDRAKIVNVGDLPEQSNYFDRCTNTVPNDDGENPSSDGVIVTFDTDKRTTYSARVNFTSPRVILCYRLETKGWVWVKILKTFAVGVAHPAFYTVNPDPPYATQKVLVTFMAAAGATLGSNDEIRFVRRGSGVNGFDCSTAAASDATATASAAVSTVRVEHKVCTDRFVGLPSPNNKYAALWTVCYRVDGGTWAEVPARTSGRAPLYQPLRVRPLPWLSPFIPSMPRLFELLPLHYDTVPSPGYTDEVIKTIAATSTATPCDFSDEYDMAKSISVVNPTTNPNVVHLGLGETGTFYPLVNIYSNSVANKDVLLLMQNTPLTVGSCDPCSFAPDFGYPDTIRRVSFSGVGLDTNDRLRIIPAALGPIGCVTAKSSDTPFQGVYTALSAFTSANTAVFDIPISASTRDGPYIMCYSKGASGTFVAVANSTGGGLYFFVFPQSPNVAASCPDREFLFGQRFTINFTSPIGPLSANDKMFVAPVAAGANCEASKSSSSIVQGTLDESTVEWTTFVVMFPRSNLQSDQYRFCYLTSDGDTKYRQVGRPFRVGPLNPAGIAVNPPQPTIDTTGLAITITGTALTIYDQVYLIDAANSNECYETCATGTVTPTQFENAGTGLQTTLSTAKVPNSVIVTINNPIKAEVTLAVCYRISRYNLVRLPATIHVGPPNPRMWRSNFVPRVGTAPTFTFEGKNLAVDDSAHIIPESQTCGVASNTIISTGVAVTATGDTSEFQFVLTKATADTRYHVCYMLKGNTWVLVPPVLVVQPNPVTSYITSNVPMAGRATEISFPAYSASTGILTSFDEARVVCGTCSCYSPTTPPPPEVPYGSPLATLQGGKGPVIRIGIVSAKYVVCYKIADSGFAPVGQPFTAVASVPSAATVSPEPTLKGQRLTFALVAPSTGITLSTQDTFMLVTKARGCWESPSINPDGIIASKEGTQFASGTITATRASFMAHVPSLGPGMNRYGTFPLDVLVCVKEKGQAEFAHAAYPPLRPFTIQPPDPPTYSSVPDSPVNGQLNVRVIFPNSKVGDRVYAVAGPYSNAICTDPASQVLSPTLSAHPAFVFTASTNTAYDVTFCYIKQGGTVAEVPQQMVLSPGNPRSWTHSFAGERLREYLTYSVTGIALDATTDTVTLSDRPCAENTPIQSSALVHRMSSLSQVSADTVQFTAQVLPRSSTDYAGATLYMCYQHNNAWRQLAPPLSFTTATPTHYSLNQLSPRQGQHLKFALSGLSRDTLADAGSIAAEGNDNWCSNTTDMSSREPYLYLAPDLISITYAETAGWFTLCTMVNNRPWADVFSAPQLPSRIYLQGPNPSKMKIFPVIPRVGQRVTFTFSLVVAYSSGDRVKVVKEDPTISCADAVPYQNTATMPTLVNSLESQIAIRDSRDALQYESFQDSGVYTVCYYSGIEKVWSAAGSTFVGSRADVLERTPDRWTVATGALMVRQYFTLSLEDTRAANVMNASEDIAWLVPPNTHCGNPKCTKCVSLKLDVNKSDASTVVTTEIMLYEPEEYYLCYRLADATGAMIPGVVNVTTGDILCVEDPQKPLRIGEFQSLTVRMKPNTDTTGDSLQFAKYVPGAVTCADNLIKDFPIGRAVISGSTDSTVTFDFEFPVSMTEARYTVCYLHNNAYVPLCLCGDGVTNCYLETAPADPSLFNTTFFPTYVGQRITLQVYTTLPLAAIKLVKDDDTGLRSCQEPATISGLGLVLRSGHYISEFKHDYRLGSAKMLVCVRTSASTTFRRVPNPSPMYNQVLFIRPFVSMTTFPSDSRFFMARQTISLTLTYPASDTVSSVSNDDEWMFVQSLVDCDEPRIAAPGVSTTVAALFIPEDTAIASWPGRTTIVSAADKSTMTFVTFRRETATPWFVCYRPAEGTWAPVENSQLSIKTPVIDPASCSFSKLDNGNLPAWFYSHATVTAVGNYAQFLSSDDRTRVVPHNVPCISDAASVYEYHVHYPQPTTIEALFVAPYAGAWKLCIQIGGNKNETHYSPMCSNVPVKAPAVIADVSFGCFFVGQTLQIKYKRDTAIMSKQFLATDTYRVAPAHEGCDVLPPSTKTALPGVWVNGAQQAAPPGAQFSSVDAAQNTATLESIYFSNAMTPGTVVQLCYTDASGREFAVPLMNEPEIALFLLAPRHTVKYTIYPERPQKGQLIILRYEADPVALRVQPFTPSMPFTIPWQEPLPAVDITQYDAHALLPSNVNTEGLCGASAQALQRRSVVGSNVTTYGNADAESSPQMYLPCYQLRQCSPANVGPAFRIYGENPNGAVIEPSPPRRGQLFKTTYKRDPDPDSVPLQPGVDKGGAHSTHCWNLDQNDGSIVQGTPDETWSENIVYAQERSVALPVTKAKICYKLAQGSWSRVPPYEFDILAANPDGFTTYPEYPTVDQSVDVTFTGNNLGNGDVAKVIFGIPRNCTDDTLPAYGTYALDSTGRRMRTTGGPAGYAGWPVTASGATTTLTFTTNVTGNYSLCYRIASEQRWTLVYGVMIIHDRNPQMIEYIPTTALESELFTMVAQPNEDLVTLGALALSPSDRVYIMLGVDRDCLAPDPSNTNLVRTAPVRIDELPANLSFQLSAGRRGDYTVCYEQRDPHRGNRRVVTWGYPILKIIDNPVSFDTLPTIARVQQIIGIWFVGYGLQSNDIKSDSVHIMEPRTNPDSAYCRTGTVTNDMELVSFVAYGNQSVATYDTTNAVVGKAYVVCYRLFGGQYHPLHERLVLQDKISVTLSLTAPTSSSAVVAGEALRVSVASVRTGDFAYLSTNGCREIPVTIPPHRLSPLPEVLLPQAATLSYGAVQQASTSQFFADVWFPSSGQYWLCYRSPLDEQTGSTSILTKMPWNITAGQPTVNPTVTTVAAWKIFAVSLTGVSLGLSSSDSTDLVSNPADCRNTIANSASLFRSSVVAPPGEAPHFYTAARNVGRFYICYVRSGSCRPSGQECARIIGVGDAVEQDPLDWFTSSSQGHVNEELGIVFRTGLKSATDFDQDTAWVAFLSSDVSPSTTSNAVMTVRRADACLQTSLNPASSTRYNLTYQASAGVFRVRPTKLGTYAVCYSIATDTDTLPHLFPSYATKPLTILGAGVVAAQLITTNPVVSLLMTFSIEGFGLSASDVCAIVRNVPDTTTLPSDICTDTVAFPQTNCEAVTSIPSTRTLNRKAVTSVAGRYVLCYGAASSSSVKAVTIPFIVGSLVLQVQVMSQALVTNTPLQLQYDGISLNQRDRVAFVKYTSGGSSTVADCVGATFVQVSYVVSGGTSAAVTTVLTSPGAYRTCYLPYYGTVTMLPNIIQIGERTVTGITFSRQPVCQELKPCLVQPRVAMLDKNGERASDVSATIELRLRVNDTAAGYVQNALARPIQSALVNQNTFWFFDLTVLVSGTYQLEATVRLSGGAVYTTTSSFFEVSESSGISHLVLQCSPFPHIIKRPGTITASNPVFSCSILSNVSFSPSAFTITTSAGVASTPTEATLTSGDLSNGYQRKHVFTVTPPYADLSVSFIVLTVAPSGVFTNQRVANSPMVLRVATVPVGKGSTQACTAPANSPAPISGTPVVRVGEELSCAIQGRVNVNGFEQNVQTFGSSFIVTSTLNDDTATLEVISLPYYADDLNGLFTVAVPVRSSTKMAVSTRLRDVVSGTATADEVIGSPQTFLVAGVPMHATITCTSERTGSKSLFTPSEIVPCTIQPRNGQGPVTAAGSDYNVVAAGGATVNEMVDPYTFSTSLSFKIATPPSGIGKVMPHEYAGEKKNSSSSNNSSDYTNIRRVMAVANSDDKKFDVEARYVPKGLSLEKKSYTLLYVTNTAGPTLPNSDGETSVTLQGSGLSPTSNWYRLASSAACDVKDNSPVVSAATGSNGGLVLTFLQPDYSPFFLCFTTVDSVAQKYIPLITRPFTVPSPQTTVPGIPSQDSGNRQNASAGGASSSTGVLEGSNLILLIVGLVLLVALILLLLIVFCCLWRRRSRTQDDIGRINDQYIATDKFDRYAVSHDTVMPYQPTDASYTPQKQYQQQQQQQQDNNNDEENNNTIPPGSVFSPLENPSHNEKKANQEELDNTQAPLGDTQRQQQQQQQQQEDANNNTVNNNNNNNNTAPTKKKRKSKKDKKSNRNEEFSDPDNDSVDYTAPVPPTGPPQAGESGNNNNINNNNTTRSTKRVHEVHETFEQQFQTTNYNTLNPVGNNSNTNNNTNNNTPSPYFTQPTVVNGPLPTFVPQQQPNQSYTVRGHPSTILQHDTCNTSVVSSNHSRNLSRFNRGPVNSQHPALQSSSMM